MQRLRLDDGAANGAGQAVSCKRAQHGKHGGPVGASGNLAGRDREHRVAIERGVNRTDGAGHAVVRHDGKAGCLCPGQIGVGCHDGNCRVGTGFQTLQLAARQRGQVGFPVVARMTGRRSELAIKLEGPRPQVTGAWVETGANRIG